MSHHPSCPYYPIARPCAFSCHLLQLPDTDSYLPQKTLAVKPPPYPSTDAIQSTRLVRQSVNHADNPLGRTNTACDRRVHFGPSRRSLARSHESIYQPCTRRPLSSSCTTTIPRPILRLDKMAPPQPTIYIVTFATDTMPKYVSNVMELLDSQLPRRSPPIPHLHTVDARSFTPPSHALCARYSGISPLIQDVVMQDDRARRAVQFSVLELLRCGERGLREVSMSVCCHAGTHRSVAIGERIAQGVKAEVGRLGCVEGVKVVVRHVSRIKGKGDPF